jgi:hypothetical protein
MMFKDYCNAQLRNFASRDAELHRRLHDALAPHAYDGTEGNRAIDGALPDIENSATAAAIKSVVAKQYGNTVPLDAAIEVVLKLREDGALT